MKPFQISFQDYYVSEVKGIKDNPEILKYFDALGFSGEKLKDETAWCAAHVNYCLLKAGYRHSGKLNARSLIGIHPEAETPKLGDICVFWRVNPDGWQAHVGFYINESKQSIRLLGGNQGNMVQIINYPKSRLLTIMRPTK